MTPEERAAQIDIDEPCDCLCSLLPTFVQRACESHKAIAQAIREAKIEAYEEAARRLESAPSVHSEPIARQQDYERRGEHAAYIRALKDSLVSS